MKYSFPLRTLGLFTLLALPNCGGGSPPPDAPTAEPSSSSDTPAPPSSADSPSEASSASAPASDDKKAASDSSGGDKPADTGSDSAGSRSMTDTITAPTIAYMINYNESDPKSASDAACTKKSGDDPRAHAKCMEKERGEFLADVLVFAKDDKGFVWTVFRRAGATLKEVSKSRIDFADDKPTSVSIKIKSDKGHRVLFVGKKDVTLSAPSDATVELQDPKYGKLVYDARIGLVNGGTQKEE